MWLEEHGDEPYDDRPTYSDLIDDEPNPHAEVPPGTPIAEDPWAIPGPVEPDPF
jgi:hypothetical protein